MSTPISSASSPSRSGGDHKRRKLDIPAMQEVDESKPVFLKMSFRKGNELDEPDPKVEDDATYNARPWQERSSMVPLILAFRVQFNELFDGVPDMGPQDIEEGLETEMASADVQELLCRLLTLAANRAKPVEYPQYNRPLSDCVSLHYATRGDPIWKGANPLAANKRFLDLNPDDRLRLMCCLLDWALTESKVVREKIEEAYKNRTAPRIHSHNPYEFNSIGRDDKKHGYYLLKGINTRFRLYIETDSTKSPSRWYSICSTLEELRQLTTELSDSAKTVRCRKIVDDLASIHIPEVERAQTVCAQIIQKKARVENERNRRAIYASEISEGLTERGSRTRGRRVDYNSMLQGQGEDDEDNVHRRGTSTPEHLQSSRSGRMLKRPRGWDDEIPEADTKTASEHSLAPQSLVQEADDEDGQDSLIVILKYKPSVHMKNLGENSQARSTLSPIHSAVFGKGHTQDTGPIRALPSVSTYELSSATHVTEVDESILPTHDASVSNTQTPKHASTQTADGSGRQYSETDTTAAPMASTGARTSMPPEPSRHCLILSRLTHGLTSSSYLDQVLPETVSFAVRNGLVQIDIVLFTDFQQTHRVPTSDNFVQLQRFLSSLYIRLAKLGNDRGVELDVHVIFHDWCGYEVAKEDIHWAVLATTKNDEDLAQTFLDTIRHTYPARQRPDLITTEEPSSTFEDAVSHEQNGKKDYDVVAVGGTFDHLHAGHKILLTMTAWLARRRLVCGITDDALLVNKKYKEVMQNINDRKRYVQAFYHRIKRNIDYELVAINDVAGPTGSDATIQALVASRETEAGSAQIREIRNTNHLPPLDILFIDVIGPEGEVRGEEMASLKLSSTAIRAKLASKL